MVLALGAVLTLVLALGAVLTLVRGRCTTASVGVSTHLRCGG